MSYCSHPHCHCIAIYSNPDMCKDHLIAHVMGSVKNTIEEYSLMNRSDKVCVAVSGGKDSITVLSILHELGYVVSGLAVDEGIEGYREHTLSFLKDFCKERSIPLKIVTFQELFGKPLDQLVKGQHPCSICGVFRRYALNKYAAGFDLIATGHNLDDEAQAVLMNLIKANKDLHRCFLRTPDAKGFTPRVKPLFFIPEKMIRAYTILKGFDMGYDECPYVPQSLRGEVRDTLNQYESEHPGMKLHLVKAALRVATTKSHDLEVCKECGEPSAHDICRTCTLKKDLGL